MPSLHQFIREYKAAYAHKGGVKALALGLMDPDWFREIQREMTWVFGSQSSSNVAATEHTTNWTRPIGVARQFSLYNPTGKPDDYLTDFAPPAKVGKKLVFPHLAATARFAKMFGDDLWNLRLNGLGKGSRLSLHEEDPISPLPTGVECKVRFHLPIFTSPKAEMLLDGESFHFQEGVLYFFHHGCVHAAVNNADEPRYHFVLDCLLTPELFRRVFPGPQPSVDPGFARFDWKEARAGAQGRPSPVDEFVTEAGEIIRGPIDYGRKVPSPISYYRKNYPSVFRPIDRLVGARH